jgi:hypothetical protein
MKQRSRYITLISLLLITNSIPTSPTSSAQAPGLPNSKLTPGATNPAVTQSTIGSTICVIGYTKTIRPPVSYTNKLKYDQLHSGYNVNGDLNMRDYEEDHLIPLEVGGHPSSPLNLFPQYYKASAGARYKDKLENKMHLLVCSGRITLKAAQAVFRGDWTAGYRKYVGALN